MAERREKPRKPLGFSKTVASKYLADQGAPAPPRRQPRGLGGRPAMVGFRAGAGAAGRPLEVVPTRPVAPLPAVASGRQELRRLVREWLAEVKVMGRSPKTLEWYEKKWWWYLDHEGGPQTLEGLTSGEVKRLLGALQDRGLSPNTVHGFFQVIRGFANWAVREGYPVDQGLLKLRPPKVPQLEMETYTEPQLEAVIAAAAPGWARLSVQILLGTGMRVGELVALDLEDYEDDGEVCFLKVRRGKGAKFRRVPVSSQLRREIDRYLNRSRPDCGSPGLLVLSDGRRPTTMTVEYLLRRIALRVGFRVHAHKFRHTFATGYLRRGGEIERLRRILGHSSYVMVMRYLHLDKGDLGKDFDQRTPF